MLYVSFGGLISFVCVPRDEMIDSKNIFSFRRYCQLVFKSVIPTCTLFVISGLFSCFIALSIIGIVNLFLFSLSGENFIVVLNM